MSLKTVFVALQTGSVDGQENPLTQIYSQKFQDVQTYLSMTGHVYTPAYLTAGANFARLPPDVQKILADTAKDVEPDVLKLADGLDGELLGKMKGSGIKVNEVDKAAFVAASKDIYDEFSKEVPAGKKLIDKCLSLATGS
jgi:TRAP-type C4-dicarboxylate transport system substrate-binding protein